jgi:regulator of cell morphogenesis and NO signaling
MIELSDTPTIGSFVARDYRTASVFQKYGIDFCCKGGKSLDEVCEKKQIDPNELLSELLGIMNRPDNSVTDFQSWRLDRLADYIEKKHHRYIVETTPALMQFLDKLCKVHGEKHPELFKIREEFGAAIKELARHMGIEERILFPFIRSMVSLSNNNGPLIPPGFGTVRNPVSRMMKEHEVEGDRFSRIAEWTDQYNPPADACTTYRVAFSMLKEFDEDLHMHIHLENNILFPKAIELEKEVLKMKSKTI